MALTIEIRGDYTSFQQDMAKVRAIAKSDAKAISDAMNNSISMNAAATQMSGLAKNLNIAARSAQAVKANTDVAVDSIRKIGEAAGVSGRQFERMAQQSMKVTAARRLENSMRQIQRATGASTMEMAKLRLSIGDNVGAMKTMGIAASESFGKIINLRNAIMAGTAAIAFSKFADLTSEYTDLEARLRNVTKSANEADLAMGRIKDTADRTYASIGSTSELFLQNALAFNDLGYSVQQQLNFMDAMTSALVVSGAKGQQAESVIRALSQAMMEGVLKGDNWNTVLQKGGRVVKALADGLGVSIDELRKMASNQQLTSKSVFAALTSQIQKLNEEAEAMPASINDAFVKMRNQIFTTVGEIDKMSGSSQRVVASIDDITSAIKANQSTIGDVIEGVAWLAGAIIDFAGSATRGIQTVSLGWIAIGDVVATTGQAMQKTFEKLKNPFSGTGLNDIWADYQRGIQNTRDTVRSLLIEIDNVPSAASKGASGMNTAANAADNTANAAWNAADAYRDLAAAMSLIGGMGVSIGKSMESDMKILTDFTKQARSAATTARDQAKANADLAYMSLDAQRQKFINAGDFESALDLNIQLEHQADLLREIERGEIGVATARSRSGGGRRKGGSGLNDEAKAIKEHTQNLQEQLHFYEQLRDVMPAAGDQYARIRQELLALEEEQYRAIGISEEFLAVWREYSSLREATDAVSGLKVAMMDYVSGLTEAQMAQDLFTTFTDEFSGALFDVVTGAKSAKEAFGDMGKAIVDQLIKMMIQMYVMKPIVEWMMGALGGGGNAGLLGNIASVGMGLVANAKGNVFAGPGINAYSNQIITKPTLFPFAKGIGLMGEAGAEAVVPLTRTPSGRLGVESVGGYKQSAPVINVQVVNQTSAKANPQVTTTTNRDGSMNMRVVLKEVDKGLAGLESQGQSRLARRIETDGDLSSRKAKQSYFR